jgi:hypothetical protein
MINETVHSRRRFVSTSETRNRVSAAVGVAEVS